MTSPTPDISDDGAGRDYGDPNPQLGASIFGEMHHVHWLGYLRDPSPTEALRRQGRSVIVCGDAPWLMSNEHVLPPTAFPLPAPWGERWLKYMTRRARLLVGDPEQGPLCLSDGATMVQVDIETWVAARACGFKHVKATWPDVAQQITDHVRTSLPVPAAREFEIVALGDLGKVVIPRRCFDLLVDLGVSDVLIGGPIDPVIAEGVAIVMPCSPDSIVWREPAASGQAVRA